MLNNSLLFIDLEYIRKNSFINPQAGEVWFGKGYVFPENSGEPHPIIILCSNPYTNNIHCLNLTSSPFGDYNIEIDKKDHIKFLPTGFLRSNKNCLMFEKVLKFEDFKTLEKK